MKTAQVLFLFLFISWTNAEDMSYGLSHVCLQLGEKTCMKWNTTVNLNYYYSFNYYMCFPQNTRVLTSAGPVKINQIKIGDEILSYDFDSDKNVFSPVTAWIHRDTDSQVEYTVIKTQGGNTYLASNGHNIAFNNNGKIGFKYADQLTKGDQLISTGGNYTVESSQEKQYQRGLYSPMTKANNFYIYPDFSVQDNDLRNSMVLVHCLAQIQNPQKKQHWIHTMMDLSGWVGFNVHQNQLHQNYYHPITHLMKIFGQKHRQAKYLIAKGDLNHLQALPSGGSSSSSWGSSSSSWGSSNYWGYTSSDSQQRRENKKRNLLAIFSCLLQISSLIIS